MALNYPPKPWTNGQKASLMPGMEFMYSSSTRKWVPITPNFENEDQLQESFGVRTIVELAELFKEGTAKINTFESKLVELKDDIVLSGRIWKSSQAPTNPNANDVWFEIGSGKNYYYDEINKTWIQY